MAKIMCRQVAKIMCRLTFRDIDCLVLCVYSISGNNFCDRDCPMVFK